VIDLTSIIRHTAIFITLILASNSICVNQAQSQPQPPQRACVITDEGTTVCGKPTTSQKKVNEINQEKKNMVFAQEFRLDDYIFKFKKCQKLVSSAMCMITIVNNGAERNLKITANSLSDSSIIIMTDTIGEEYRFEAKSLDMGERKDKTVTFKPTRGNSYDLVLHFPRVARSTNKAQKLLLPVTIDGTSRMVLFTNITMEIFM
jgi:hypothetical protein